MPVEAFGEVVRSGAPSSPRGRRSPSRWRSAPHTADDTWLGTASSRESVYVACTATTASGSVLLTAVEPVFRAHEVGRTGARAFADRGQAGLYPRFDDFRAARAAVDPDGVLLNPHRALLGIEVEGQSTDPT